MAKSRLPAHHMTFLIALLTLWYLRTTTMSTAISLGSRHFNSSPLKISTLCKTTSSNVGHALITASSSSTVWNQRCRHHSFLTSTTITTRKQATAITDDGDSGSSTTTEKKSLKNCNVVSQMPPTLPPLKNHYYLLRHGQSTGNVAGVISSARSLARNEKHGLTSLGYEQARSSAENLLRVINSSLSSDDDDDDDDDDGGASSSTPPTTLRGEKKRRRVILYSSPFARARQTAEACLDELRTSSYSSSSSSIELDLPNNVILEDGLMERFFGRLDGEKLHTYAYVWPVDMFNVTHTAFDVESVAAVATRLYETLLRIDERHTSSSSTDGDGDGAIIVLASHADVLQILQVYAAGVSNVGTFSSYRFGNGEVRYMGRDEGCLPEPQPMMPPQRGT